MGNEASRVRAHWGGALLIGGGATALWFGASLGFFFLTDGRTLLGASYRADPEFQRYWMVNGPIFLLALGAAWLGNGLRGGRAGRGGSSALSTPGEAVLGSVKNYGSNEKNDENNA